MADYLVYWKSFWEDCREGDADLSDWWSRDKALYNGIGLGDTLWLVVTGGSEFPDEWRLMSALRLRRKSVERTSRYGQYHFLCDARASQSFRIARQPDLAAILRLLEFASGKGLRVARRNVGQRLQKPRRLTPADSALLSEYADTL